MRFLVVAFFVSIAVAIGPAPQLGAQEQVSQLPQPVERTVDLAAGEVAEIGVSIVRPSDLAANGRLLVKWESPDSRPELGWSKRLHALDSDVYLLYRAPVAGKYRLTVAVDNEPTDLFEKNRWREKGVAPLVAPVTSAKWTKEKQVAVKTFVQPVPVAGETESRLVLETEPNNTAELAQPIAMPTTTDEYSLHVLGTSDDIEYFDNGHVGEPNGDDWFRLDFPGPEPRLLTACLGIPDQQVAAQIRCYKAGAKPGEMVEYRDGANPNERAHQQSEHHRTAINRRLEPGQTYFLRVEANAPGYELQLRVVKTAPFTDPRRAVRQALYDHIGQVDAWLTNRPRGASIERRIRDAGNLLGTGCMSCHTQSGVWGPAIPIALGYRPENVQSWRNLVNISYQSMRPTNKLIDAANNTSLAPLDTGDGQAGTRVAGHAVASFENIAPPRKLQSKQLIRAANLILQTGDPGGVNAAGPGANYGTGVVYNYTGEVLVRAWQASGNPYYFHALVERAGRFVKFEAKYTDDLAHRVEFFRRFFPADYPACAERVPHDAAALADARWKVQDKAAARGMTPEKHRALADEIAKQVAQDVARLRAIQGDDGAWNFAPGTTSDGGQTWQRDSKAGAPDPAPTALALVALQAAGATADDPAVAKGVAALLKMQHPTGYWNGASQTGFVTTSYALHALSRLFPAEPSPVAAEQFAPAKNESLIQTLRRVRDLAQSGLAKQHRPELAAAARHPFPLVRFWAMVGLGDMAAAEGVPALVAALGDSAKPVREAAHWGLRQTLINDLGWNETFAALKTGDDRTRESIARALVMRVDGVLPESQVGWERLTAALSQGMLDDAHPAVRAWASRAAWNWWIWNPPVRSALNDAWVKLLTRPEPCALVENCHRYQTQALFIANGHRANGSGDHQYAELGTLFKRLGELAAAPDLDPRIAERLNRRLVAVAATFYEQAGGDGGPGQMGYGTPGAKELFGEAILTYLANVDKQTSAEKQTPAPPTKPGPVAPLTRANIANFDLRLGLEGAANVPNRDLQGKLIEYSLHGPEELRPIAAGSISDPKSAQLVAVPEALEPLLGQILRGAAEPDRRAQLSDPLFKLFARVRWIVPQTVEQQRQALGFLIPQFTDRVTFAHLDSPPLPTVAGDLARRREADWYVASNLGDVLGENPDLHIDTVFEFFPREFSTATQARFWLPSINWILTYKTQLPDVKVDAGQLPPVDPFAEPRSRGMRLFLSQIAVSAEPRNIELAVQLAGKTALRRNPEVLTALEQLTKVEPRKHVVEQAQRVLSTGRESFLKDLAAAVKSSRAFSFPADGDGQPKLPQPFIDDVTYFRDYVTPEMSTVLRGDQRSCFACHGVPGRVPPLTLNPPDDAGYLSVAHLLENYRLLQERVDVKNVERSKLLRKPLNVDTGEDDGHQGGRRYQPTDPGYQVLLKWAKNQVELKRQ